VAGVTEYAVGSLAEATGLTVRTLHHWDEIGLLRPAARTQSGHRRYSAADVERLYRILALRRLGLALPAVEQALEGEDLRAAVAAHLERIDAEIALRDALRRRLERILAAIDGLDGPTTEQIIEAIEVMTMSDRYYTPEQQEQLAVRARELGEEGMRAAEREWAELIAAVEAERAAGTDPQDPKVQALAKRWSELIQAFTGGDAEIAASLKRMYAEEGVARASRGMVSPELLEYVSRAGS
jgi:MerR family transcriptional regulator, thiopeptide resistance regulator